MKPRSKIHLWLSHHEYCFGPLICSSWTLTPTERFFHNLTRYWQLENLTRPTLVGFSNRLESGWKIWLQVGVGLSTYPGRFPYPLAFSVRPKDGAGGWHFTFNFSRARLSAYFQCIVTCIIFPYLDLVSKKDIILSGLERVGAHVLVDLLLMPSRQTVSCPVRDVQSLLTSNPKVRHKSGSFL